jgi:hypothetical protein
MNYQEEINKVLDGMESLARMGKYREKKELLDTVRSFRWFGNFGEPQQRRIEQLEAQLEEHVDTD